MILSKTKGRFHERMLRVAAELSDLSDVPRHKFGAVFVQNKTIVSSGHNQRKTHPMQYELNKKRADGKQDRSWVHAEAACLLKLRHVAEGGTLYIARVGMSGEPMMARPCAGCMSAIVHRKIKTIVYTTDLGYAVEQIRCVA